MTFLQPGTSWRTDQPRTALALAPGGDFDSAAFLPPSGTLVEFETFDGNLHYGETLTLVVRPDRPTQCVVFFERIDNVPRVYFAEYVKSWTQRGHLHRTELYEPPVPVSALKPYTVVYDEPVPIKDIVGLWQGFNCLADDAEHAEEQCKNTYPLADIVWINEGHNNFSQDPV